MNLKSSREFEAQLFTTNKLAIAQKLEGGELGDLHGHNLAMIDMIYQTVDQKFQLAK